MIKSEELQDPRSCLSRARNDEMIFVLLGRDIAAPAAIRAWVAERIRTGKNKWEDGQIVDAMQCAARMEEEERARAQREAASCA